MTDTLAPGVLLLATPWLKDPNFDRAVVLICLHSDEGTMGLVLNRPLGVTAGQGLAGVVSAERREMPLYGGGPVTPDTLFALHTLASLHEASTPVCDGIDFVHGTDDLLGVLQAPPGEDETLRLFAGCAGWAPGQLEAEIADNAWILAPAQEDFVFARSTSSLWARVMRSLGPYMAFLARMPEDLRVN